MFRCSNSPGGNFNASRCCFVFIIFFVQKSRGTRCGLAASCVNLLTPCLGMNRAVFGAGCLDSVMETWGQQKISFFLVVETMAISSKLGFHKKKLLENTGFWDIFFCLEKLLNEFSRVSHFGRHGVLIWSGSPQSSTIYQEACGQTGSFDLFVVCDTWEVVPRSEWRVSKRL